MNHFSTRVIRWIESSGLVDHSESSTIITNTGTLRSNISHLLFTLHANACWANSSNVFNVKFADDTAIVGLFTEDQTKYGGCMEEFSCSLFFNYNDKDKPTSSQTDE